MTTTGRTRRSTSCSAQRKLTVPTMLVVGQWDQEDSYGAPAVYRALEPQDTNNDMLTPGDRAVAAQRGQLRGLRRSARLTFEGDTGAAVPPRRDEAVPRPSSEGPCAARQHAAGADLCDRRPTTGSRRRHWPDGDADAALPRSRASGSASTSPAPAGHDDYVSDPAKPVPFVPRPVHLRRRRRVEALAGPRPALRRRPARRADL